MYVWAKFHHMVSGHENNAGAFGRPSCAPGSPQPVVVPCLFAPFQFLGIQFNSLGVGVGVGGHSLGGKGKGNQRTPKA